MVCFSAASLQGKTSEPARARRLYVLYNIRALESLECQDQGREKTSPDSIDRLAVKLSRFLLRNVSISFAHLLLLHADEFIG